MPQWALFLILCLNGQFVVGLRLNQSMGDLLLVCTSMGDLLLVCASVGDSLLVCASVGDLLLVCASVGDLLLNTSHDMAGIFENKFWPC